MIEYTVKVWENRTEWFLNGLFHREDGPACEYADGSKYWFLNGKFHREDGPAVELSDGSKYWFLNGKCHREDGPAVEYSDGPAVEYSDGKKRWYLEGEELTEEDFLQRKKPCSGKKITIDGVDYTLV